MPFEIFIPQLNVEFEKTALKDAKDRGLEELDEAVLEVSLSRHERKARAPLYDAANELFVYQKQSMALTLIDFNQKLVEMWRDRPAVHEARLSEFDKLDPRWAKYDEKGGGVFVARWCRKPGRDSKDES